MNGFVKLRRGLLDHLRSGRIAFAEFALHTVLIALADHRTGVYHGSQRRLAAAAGISSAQTWKLLTALEGKGYVEWLRRQSSVRIVKYHPVQNPVDMSGKSSGNPIAPGSAGDQPGLGGNQPIRNIGTPLKNEILASASSAGSAGTPTGLAETKTRPQPRAGSSAGDRALPPPAPSPSPDQSRALERELRAVCFGNPVPPAGPRPGSRGKSPESRRPRPLATARVAAPPAAWLSPRSLDRRRRLLERQRAQLLARPRAVLPAGRAVPGPAFAPEPPAAPAQPASERGSGRAAVPALPGGSGAPRPERAPP